MDLKPLFSPKSVAVVGASKKKDKVGQVIFSNLVNGRYSRPVYAVNPKYDSILGKKCYPSVLDIKRKVETAIICTPSVSVPSVLRDCAEKGVSGAIVISGGFGESGKKALEKEIVDICKKNRIAMLGPNCLGVIDTNSGLDSVFLPLHKMKRPDPGDVAVITQSGAVGSCIVDLATSYNIGFSKMVSYGNAAMIDESDLLEYLGSDRKTRKIILYLEGTKNGRKLYKTLKSVCPKKPVVVLKAGRSAKSSEAAKTHTGNLAGEYSAYRAAFRGSGAIEAMDVDDLFGYVKILGQPYTKGGKVGIITNGGGFGVLSGDALEELGLSLAIPEKKTLLKLSKFLPPYSTPANPLDIIADADVKRYGDSIEAFMSDKNIDIILVMVLFQTPKIREDFIPMISRFSADKRKPIAVVAVGGDYIQEYAKMLHIYGVPVFGSPMSAARAIKALVYYSRHRR